MPFCARCDKICNRITALCDRCHDVAMGVTNDVPWTPFEPGSLPEDINPIAAAFIGDSIFLNNIFQVAVRQKETPSGLMLHLSIKRIDKQPIRDWRDLQRIKNELVGPEVQAVEIFPAESQLVDTSNQYHLWCFPDAVFPFAFNEGRLVTEAAIMGSVQRPWPLLAKPKDLKSKDEVLKKTQEALSKKRGG